MNSQRSPITTHILDVSLGRPARHVAVTLARLMGDGSWKQVAQGATDNDGRVCNLLPAGAPAVAGTYRMRFETGAYFGALGTQGFYPYVEIVFEVGAGAEHYHVPLLLSPYGYSTYRGS